MAAKVPILDALESILSQSDYSMDSVLDLWIEMNSASEIERSEHDLLIQRVADLESSNKSMADQNNEYKEQARKHTVRFGVLKNLSKEISKQIDDEIAESKKFSETKKQERIESNNQFSKRLAAISERLQLSTNRRKEIEEEKQIILTEIQDCLSKITSSEAHFEKTTSHLEHYNLPLLDEFTQCDVEMFLMSKEDNLVHLNHYSMVEAALRAELAQYSRMFDTIHSKLDESRKVYANHQAKISELEKQIKLTEKNNTKLTKKVLQSEKNVSDIQAQETAVESEIAKTNKAIQRYNSLISVFESEISHLAI